MYSNWFMKYKIPTDATLIIDGKAISASEFVNTHSRVTFNSLKIETSTINIYAKGMHGVLDGSSGVIKLKTTVIVKNNVTNKNRMETYKKMHDKFLFGLDKSPLI